MTPDDLMAWAAELEGSAPDRAAWLRDRALADKGHRLALRDRVLRECRALFPSDTPDVLVAFAIAHQWARLPDVVTPQSDRVDRLLDELRRAGFKPLRGRRIADLISGPIPKHSPLRDQA